MHWKETALGTAMGCAVAIAFTTTAFAQTGGSSGGAASGGSSAGSTGAASGGTGAATGAGAGVGPTLGTGLSTDTSGSAGSTGPAGWRGLGLALPDLGGSGIEPPQFIFGVRGEVTLSDNLRHRPPGQERNAMLVEASPYVIARSMVPRANYDLVYQMRNFLRIGDDPDFEPLRHNMNGRGSFALVGDNLWLDLSAFMGSVNTSASGTLSVDPSSSFDNRSDYRQFTIAPWYQDRLGNLAVYRGRYELTRSDGSNGLTLAKWQHHASASVDGIDTGAKWNWGWNGFFQRRDFGNDITLDRRFSAGTLHYRYSHRLRLSASIEYEQIDNVLNDEGEDHGWGPGFGIQWSPNSRLNLSAHVADRYYGSVGDAQITWATRRSTLGLTASKSVQTSTDPSVLTLDPLALATGPSGVPSSIVSQLTSSGILAPGGVPIGRGFVTDAAVFDRRVAVFWALRGLSRTLTLSTWSSLRESPATFITAPTTGGIRGSGTGQAISFNGELRERGVGISFTQRLDARTRIEASFDRRNVKSPTAGFETRLNSLLLGVVGTLTSDVNAFAGIRLNRQTAIGNAAEYNENAIFAGVDKRF